MQYGVVFSRRAVKELDGMPARVREKIIEKVEAMTDGLTGDIKKLTNHQPAYRLRVGDYRVLFDVVGTVIEVYTVAHRKDAYDRS